MRAALVQMNGRDGQAQDAIAKRLGYSQSAVTQWINGVTCPKEDKIARMIEAFDIRPRFFTDESLGDAPDYRDFVGRTVDRDDARGTPNAEAYIAGQAAIGRPVSDEHAMRLRSIRLSSGDMAIGAFEIAHRGWLAEDAGKVVERRGEPIAAKIDEARGQRRLPPAKPRR
jgi:transcriptional regulator with XRE-family HTH domain